MIFERRVMRSFHRRPDLSLRKWKSGVLIWGNSKLQGAIRHYSFYYLTQNFKNIKPEGKNEPPPGSFSLLRFPSFRFEEWNTERLVNSLDMDFELNYEIASTADFIYSRKFTRVALQVTYISILFSSFIFIFLNPSKISGF